MSHFYGDIHADRIRDALQRLTREFVIESSPFTAAYAVTPEPVPFAKRRALSYKPIREGQEWGRAWDCGWFHLRGRVPKAWAGSSVTARLDFSGEALVFDGHGEPRAGQKPSAAWRSRCSRSKSRRLKFRCSRGASSPQTGAVYG